MRILIEFELFPEEVERYIIETEDDELIEKIAKAHGQFINGTDETDGALWLYEFLGDKKPLNLEKPLLLLSFVDMIIISGFHL